MENVVDLIVYDDIVYKFTTFFHICDFKQFSKVNLNESQLLFIR